MAGTAKQVDAAMEAAESLKEELSERGVLVVPLPVFGGESDLTQPQSSGLQPQDLKCALCVMSSALDPDLHASIHAQ